MGVEEDRLVACDPELRRRYEMFFAEWCATHGTNPRPYVVSTRRTPAEQQEKKDKGLSDAGPGQSLHNYGQAIDFMFKEEGSKDMIDKDFLYSRAFKILPKYGLSCGVWIHGGSDRLWHDKGHTQCEGFTWQQAKAGITPNWKPLPKGEVTA
jgi:hypothetical protein